MVAAEREPVRKMSFKNDRWYDVRLRVTASRIEAWADDEKIIDLEHPKHKIEPYPGMEIFAPFGLFTFDTTADLEAIRMRSLN